MSVKKKDVVEVAEETTRDVVVGGFKLVKGIGKGLVKGTKEIVQGKERKAELASSKKCPKCSGSLPSEAKFCVNCGTKL
jgi:hypothetical protein